MVELPRWAGTPGRQLTVDRIALRTVAEPQVQDRPILSRMRVGDGACTNPIDPPGESCFPQPRGGAARQTMRRIASGAELWFEKPGFRRVRPPRARPKLANAALGRSGPSKSHLPREYGAPEHVPAKWVPVRRRGHAPIHRR